MDIEPLCSLLESFLGAVPPQDDHFVDVGLPALKSDASYTTKPTLGPSHEPIIPSSLPPISPIPSSQAIPHFTPPLSFPTFPQPTQKIPSPTVLSPRSAPPSPSHLARSLFSQIEHQATLTLSQFPADSLSSTSSSTTTTSSDTSPSPSQLKHLVSLARAALDRAPPLLCFRALPELLARLALEPSAVREVEELLQWSFHLLSQVPSSTNTPTTSSSSSLSSTSKSTTSSSSSSSTFSSTPPSTTTTTSTSPTASLASAATQQLLFLRHFLEFGRGTHVRSCLLVSSVLSHALFHLSSSPTTDTLQESLVLLRSASRLHPLHFSPVFPDLLDTLVGWALDVASSSRVCAAIASLVVSELAPVVRQFVPLLLELLDKFLLDMDILSLSRQDDHAAVSKKLHRFSACFLMLLHCLSPELIAAHSPALAPLCARLFSHCFSQRLLLLRSLPLPPWVLDKWYRHCARASSRLLAHLGPLPPSVFSACLKFILLALSSDLFALAPSHPQVHEWLDLLLLLLSGAPPAVPEAALHDLLRPSLPFQSLLRYRYLQHPPLAAQFSSVYFRLLQTASTSAALPAAPSASSARILIGSLFDEMARSPFALSSDARFHRQLVFSNCHFLASSRVVEVLQPASIQFLIQRAVLLLQQHDVILAHRLVIFRLLSQYSQILFSSDLSSYSTQTITPQPSSVSYLPTVTPTGPPAATMKSLSTLWTDVAQLFLNTFVDDSPPPLFAFSRAWICRHFAGCTPFFQRKHIEKLIGCLPDPEVASKILTLLPTNDTRFNQRLASLLLRSPNCFQDQDRLSILSKLLFHLPPTSLLYSRAPSLPRYPTPSKPKTRLSSFLSFLTSVDAPSGQPSTNDNAASIPSPGDDPASPWNRDDINELVHECITTRLTFSFGRPNEMFEKIERASVASTDQRQLYWLCQFVNALESSISFVCRSSRPSLLVEKVHRFFLDHHQVCANWFARMRSSLLRGAVRARLCPADVLLQAHRLMLKQDSHQPSHREAFVAIADALLELRDADSLAALFHSPISWAPSLVLQASGHWEQAAALYAAMPQPPNLPAWQAHAQLCQETLSSWHSDPMLSPTLPRPDFPASLLLFDSRDDLASPQIEAALVELMRAPTACPPNLPSLTTLSKHYGPLRPQAWRQLLGSGASDVDALTYCVRHLRSTRNFKTASQLLASVPAPLPPVLEIERARVMYKTQGSSRAGLLQLVQSLKPMLSSGSIDSGPVSSAYLVCARWMRKSFSQLIEPLTPPCLAQFAQAVGYAKPSPDPLGLLFQCFEKAALTPSSSFLSAWQHFSDFAYARALAMLTSQLDAAGELITLTESEQAAIPSPELALAAQQLWAPPLPEDPAAHIRLMIRHRVLAHFYTAVTTLGKVIDHLDSSALTVASFRLLHLLVHFGGADDDFASLLRQTMAATRSDIWVDLLPQLFVWLGHISPAVRALLAELIVRIGTDHPLSVVYAVLAALSRVPRSAHQERGRAEMKRIVSALFSDMHQHLWVNAQTVFSEFCKISELPEERWHRVLKSLLSQGASRDSILKRFRRLTTESIDPSAVSTPHEASFVSRFRRKIEVAQSRLLQSSDNSGVQQILRQLLDELIPHLKRFSTARLSAISPTLSSLTDAPALPWMKSTESVQFPAELTILPTKTRPRRVNLLSAQGTSCPILLKGGEDLRMDERMMQFLSVANQVLSRDCQTRQRNLHAKTYAVVPLTERVGVIEWVEGYQQLFSLHQSHQQHTSLGRLSRAQAVNPSSDPPLAKPVYSASKRYHQIALEALHEAHYDATLARNAWPIDVSRRIFTRLRDETPEDVLSEALWRQSPHAMAWWETTCEFTRTLAVMSVIGYIIGLGDRHLDNILVSFTTGEVLHIDYNVCLEKGKRLAIPETVPFRLTRNLQHAVCLRDVTTEEGPFSKACTLTLTRLSATEELLTGLMSIFLYDPIVDWEPSAHLSHSSSSISSSSSTSSFREISTRKLEEEKEDMPLTSSTSSIANSSTLILMYYQLLILQQGSRLVNRLSSPLSRVIAEFKDRAVQHAQIIARFSSEDRSGSPMFSPPAALPPAAGVLSAQLMTMKRFGFQSAEVTQRVELIERTARTLDEEQSKLLRDFYRLLQTQDDFQTICQCHSLDLSALTNLQTSFEQLTPSHLDCALTSYQSQLSLSGQNQPQNLIGQLATRIVEIQPEIQSTEMAYVQMEDLIHSKLKEIHLHPMLGIEPVTAAEIKRYTARMQARRQAALEKVRTLQSSLEVAAKISHLYKCRLTSPLTSAKFFPLLQELQLCVQIYQTFSGPRPSQSLSSLKSTIDMSLREILQLSHDHDAFACKKLVQSLIEEIAISRLSPSTEKLVQNFDLVRSLVQQLQQFSDLSCTPSSQTGSDYPLLHSLSTVSSSKLFHYHASTKNQHAQSTLAKIHEHLSIPQKAIPHHVKSLIDQAISVDNLCQLYEGWIAWF